MGKNIAVDMSKLDTASSKLSQLSSEYSSIAKQLMNQASTMGTAWQGEDNQAFVSQITGFTEELEAMAKKLATASEALSQQSQNYKTRQDAITAAAKTLTN